MDSLAAMLSMLRSGSLLDREDVGRMKGTIASEESAIADLDSKILALEARRDALAKSLPIRRALIAPIRRLPPEVLADIFEHCVTDRFGNITGISPPILHRADNNTNAPFLLLRICHRWREIAEQTTRLWTNVSICCEKSIPYASFRLQISRSAPLDVFIFNKEAYYCICPRERISRPALGGLQDNDRSKEIVKKYPEFYKGLFSKLPLANKFEYHGSLEVLSILLAADMNSLKEVAITPLRAHEVPGEHFPILEAARLHTLSLYMAAHLVTYIAPTDNLRRLTLTCTGEELLIDPICDFLRSCPGIEELIFHCEYCTTIRRDNDSQSPIHLRALSNLKLQINDIANPEWIGLLHAPNLWEATISYKHMDLRPLQQFLLIARESLKSLAFQELDFSSYPPLRGLLGTLNEVETLRFGGHDCGAALWKYLTPGEGVPPECWMCPKLQHLDIHYTHGLEETSFVDFIRRRSNDHHEGLSSKHNCNSDRWYIVDINLQSSAISRSTATALSDLQVERKGLNITGFPERFGDNGSPYYPRSWAPIP